MSSHRMTHSRLAVIITALLGLAALPRQDAQAQARRDYLLGRPRASLTLRVGATRPNASNGVFAVSDAAGKRLLTLGPDQFVGASFGADLGVPISQKIELQFSASTASRRAQSEYRDFVDNRDLPIEQVSQLERTPLSMGMRYNFVPAGRPISKLAWIPTRFVPYLAAGAGVMHYRFRQNGDFIDFRSANADVFTSRLEAKGWAPLAYASGGIGWSLTPAVALNTELRYDHSSAAMRGSFTGFDRSTLSGVGLSTGLQFRF